MPLCGVVHIGQELIRYERRDGNTFYGCERSISALGDEQVDEAQAYKTGTLVYNEAVVRILAYRFERGRAAREDMMSKEGEAAG